MSLAHSLGAQIGASIREGFRARNYQNFVEILQQNNYFYQMKETDVEAVPLCLYRNAFSIVKTYCLMCPNVVFFDLAPSTGNHSLWRVGILSRRTIKKFESRDARWTEKFSIGSAAEMIEINFTHSDSKEMSFRLFAEEPGQKSLTQDIGNTVRLSMRIKEIADASA